METFLADLQYWHWFILAVGLLILEVLAPGEIFLWIAAGAGFTGLVALGLPELAWEQQAIIFAVLSVICMFGGRTYFKRNAVVSEQPNLNRRSVQFVGQRFVVEEAIVNGNGKVKVGDTLWKVTGPDLPVGTSVTVTGSDGVVLEVTDAS